MVDATGEHTFLYSNDYVNDVIIINQITFFIPEGFGRFFPNIKQFELMSSQLRFVRRSNFVQMKNLLDLRLDGNEIEFIPSNTFWDLTKLQWLSISSNKIKSLTDDLTLLMPNLLWFTANKNEIEELNEVNFLQNHKLELLSLRFNHIKTINFHLKTFKHIAFIDLSSNLCFDGSFRKSDEPNCSKEFQNQLIKNCSIKQRDKFLNSQIFRAINKK